MREKDRTNSLNGVFGLSVDSIFPCSSWPPFLGLLNVDSNNKEHSKLGSPFTKASFSLHPSHFLFLHSCWLDPDYLLKLSFTVVLTTGHPLVPLPHPTILKSSCWVFFWIHLLPVKQNKNPLYTSNLIFLTPKRNMWKLELIL